MFSGLSCLPCVQPWSVVAQQGPNVPPILHALEGISRVQDRRKRRGGDRRGRGRMWSSGSLPGRPSDLLRPHTQCPVPRKVPPAPQFWGQISDMMARRAPALHSADSGSIPAHTSDQPWRMTRGSDSSAREHCWALFPEHRHGACPSHGPAQWAEGPCVPQTLPACLQSLSCLSSPKEACDSFPCLWPPLPSC